MARRRLNVSLKSGAAMHVNRLSVGTMKLVYVIVQNKLIHYPWGNSYIAYIGTTEKGIDRISQSVAAKAPQVLRAHGVDRFDVRLVTCKGRQRVRTWRKLERAMLLAFREMYGEPPKYNVHGKAMREIAEFDLFARERIKEILRQVDSAAP